MSLLKKPQPSESKNPGESKSSTNPRQKKGPTPSRKQQEARNYQGLLGVDKKIAKERAREESRRRYEREQEGLRTGREDLLPYQHRGQARRMTRDFIDSRYSFAEFMLVTTLVLMALSLIAVSILNRQDTELAQKVNTWTLFGSYAVLILGMLDGGIIAGRAHRQCVKRLGLENIPRGLRWYAFTRAIMIRRWRSPKPQVARGKAGKQQQNSR